MSVYAQQDDTTRGIYRIEGLCEELADIEYEIAKGSLREITAHPELSTLTILLGESAVSNNAGDGKLTIKLPRTLIPSITQEGVPTGGSDVPFEVFIDGESRDVKETETTNKTRTLEIRFDQGAEEIEIVAATPFGYDPCPVDPNDKRVHLGASHIIDGHYVFYDPKLKATWNATSFAFYTDNKTFSFDITLNYLSDNPTEVKIHNGSDSTLPEEARVSTIPIEGNNLAYKTSIVFFSFSGYYPSNITGVDRETYAFKTGLIPMAVEDIDNKTTAKISFQDTIDVAPDYEYTFSQIRVHEMQLSWLRVFEDDVGNRYYQWMQGDTYCGGSYCPHHNVSVNEEHRGVSGDFLVYYPIPEKLIDGNTTIGMDYVKWIKENAAAIVIPEFGSIALLMTAVLLTVVVAAGAKNRLVK